MASYRLLRLASRIKFLVSTVIQREIQDPRMGMVTVLNVELTGDLKEATVLITIFGRPGVQSRTVRALEDARGFIQKEVAKNLQTRNTPRLKFILDEGQDKVARIEALVEEAQEDQEVAMAKKIGKKDDKSQKGIASKPSKPAPKADKKSAEKSPEKNAEKGSDKRPGKTGEEPRSKGRPPKSADGEKRPRRGFDDDDSGPAKDFEVEDLGDEETDFLEKFDAAEEEPDEDDEDDDDEEEEEEEEEKEKDEEY